MKKFYVLKDWQNHRYLDKEGSWNALKYAKVFTEEERTNLNNLAYNEAWEELPQITK